MNEQNISTLLTNQLGCRFLAFDIEAEIPTNSFVLEKNDLQIERIPLKPFLAWDNNKDSPFCRNLSDLIDFPLNVDI